jgi:hypothetical protein
MSTRLLILYLLAETLAFAASAIPDAKLVPARMRVANALHGLGVVGGIPARTDPANIVNIVAAPGSNITAALQAALDAVPFSGSEKVFLLPAGSFYFDGVGIRLEGGLRPPSDFTIRGAGMNETVLLATSSAAEFYFGLSPAFNFRSPTVVSGLTKDSNALVVTSIDTFDVGRLAEMRIPNDIRVPVFSTTSGSSYIRKWPVLVTGVNSSTNTVTFTPPLPEDFSDVATLTGLPIYLIPENNAGTVKRVGVEGLTIDKTGVAGPAISFNGTVNCWVKDVKTISTSTHGTKVIHGINFEFRGNHIAPSGGAPGASNASGVLVSSSAGVLIEDNIFENNFPCVEFWLPSMNCLVSYNFIPSATFVLGGTRYNGFGFNTHNGHSSYIVFEGNITPNIQLDAYFAGCSRIGFLRNWITGRNGVPGDNITTFALDMQILMRQNWLAGNILRAPGFTHASNGYALGQPYGGSPVFPGVQQSLGVNWIDLDQATCLPVAAVGTTVSKSGAQVSVQEFSAATCDYLEASFTLNGSRRRAAGGAEFGARVGNTYAITGGGNTHPDVGGSMTWYPGFAAFRQKDLDVEATTTFANNYNFYDGGIPVAEQTTDDIPDSLVYSSKPAFFGNKRWPIFSTTGTTTIPAEYSIGELAHLPAAHRYFYENSDYMGPSAPTFSAHPTTQAATVGATVTLTVAGGGSPAPTLQWRKGGSNISGATSSSLVLTNVQLSDAGSYDVVATNSEGTATSNVGVLTVNAAPSEGGSATIQTLNVGTLNIQ